MTHILMCRVLWRDSSCLPFTVSCLWPKTCESLARGAGGHGEGSVTDQKCVRVTDSYRKYQCSSSRQMKRRRRKNTLQPMLLIESTGCIALCANLIERVTWFDPGARVARHNTFVFSTHNNTLCSIALFL